LAGAFLQEVLFMPRWIRFEVRDEEAAALDAGAMVRGQKPGAFARSLVVDWCRANGDAVASAALVVAELRRLPKLKRRAARCSGSLPVGSG
jgi:hypothetical protein